MVNTETGYEFDWQNPDRKTFDFGRVLSRTFTSLFSSPRTLLIALAVSLCFTIASAILMSTQLQTVLETAASAEDFVLQAGYWGWTISIGVFGLLLAVWFQLVVIQTSYAAMTNTEVAKNVHGRALRLTVPMFITALIYVIVCYIGMLPLLIGTIFVWPGWALAGPMMMYEDKGIFGSLGASWTFAKGNKRYIFLLLLLTSILGSVIYSVTLGLGMVLTGISVMSGDPTAALNLPIVQQLMYNGIAGVGGYVMYALFASALTAAYVEIKTIKGGTPTVAEIFS